MKTFIGWKQKQLKIYNSASERETFFINNFSNSSDRWKLKLFRIQNPAVKRTVFILNCLPAVERKNLPKNLKTISWKQKKIFNIFNTAVEI